MEINSLFCSHLAPVALKFSLGTEKQASGQYYNGKLMDQDDQAYWRKGPCRWHRRGHCCRGRTRTWLCCGSEARMGSDLITAEPLQSVNKET